MLGLEEHKAGVEPQRRHTEQGDPPRSPRARRRAAAAFVVLGCLSVLTVIVGAILPGLGMATAVAIGWLLWRFVPDLGEMLEAASDLSTEQTRREDR